MWLIYLVLGIVIFALLLLLANEVERWDHWN
jgi:hypothetical protein